MAVTFCSKCKSNVGLPHDCPNYYSDCRYLHVEKAMSANGNMFELKHCWHSRGLCQTPCTTYTRVTPKRKWLPNFVTEEEFSV